jgi:transcription initiation factor TFIIIB Brf1 subunit/transcription initiation factor TFIIB
MPEQSITTAYRSLIAAVIERAIADLKGIGPKCRRAETDRAMAFILSDTCEGYCLELGIDCETIREKAAVLYRKIITKEEPPLKQHKSGRLSGKRPYPVPKAEIYRNTKFVNLPHTARREARPIQ